MTLSPSLQTVTASTLDVSRDATGGESGGGFLLGCAWRSEALDGRDLCSGQDTSGSTLDYGVHLQRYKEPFCLVGKFHV